MAEFFGDYGLFLAKLLTLAAVALLIVGVAAAIVSKGRSSAQGHLEVYRLNEKYRLLNEVLLQEMLDADQVKQHRKDRKQAEKKDRKKQKSARRKGDSPAKPRIFVLDFNGDLRASAVANLREEVSIVIRIASAEDEVVLRLESQGGLVNAYGLAASQLARLREAEIPLTVCVDKIAASGGYMMACVADRILAAPFAVLGSIGVVAQLPNFNRLLKRHDIDYELLTAGEYKRTLTLFGENTEEGRRKFADDLEDTHNLFKEFVRRYRPSVDIDSVSTGEIWFGERALAQNLVDALETSDSYLQKRLQQTNVFELKYIEKKRLRERIGMHLAKFLGRDLTQV